MAYALASEIVLQKYYQRNNRMKVFKFLFIVMCFVGASCSNDGPLENKTDSLPAPTNGVREIQTDSGKLVLTDIPGEILDSAVLYNETGRVVARGFFNNNTPSGAWIRYNENGEVISASHYSEGVVKYNLDIHDFATKSTTFMELGISVAIPIEWKALETPNTSLLISYEKTIKDKEILMMPNFNIAKGKLEPGQTLSSLAAEQLNMLHNAVGRVELVDESFLTIDSCKAFRRYGMYYTQDNKVGFLDAIIVKGETIWVISCAAQNREQGEFLKYQSVFENLVMSIEVL